MNKEQEKIVKRIVEVEASKQMLEDIVSDKGLELDYLNDRLQKVNAEVK